MIESPPNATRAPSTPDASPRSPLEVTGELVRVTLFEDRAEIVRHLALPAGCASVVVVGLSPCLDERSVEIIVEGAEPTSHRVFWKHHLLGGWDARTVDTLRAVARDAEQRREAARDRETRAAEDRTRLSSLFAGLIEGARRVRPRADGSATAFRSALDDVAKGIQEAIDKEAAASAEGALAALDEGRAQARLEEARHAEPELSACVALELGAPGKTEMRATLRYRVASAVWRPEHLARLVGTADGVKDGASVEIVTYATAWQTTGESWDNAKVRFSTARPNKPASPPTLTEDVLSVTRRTDQRVVIEARDQTIAVAGGSEGGARETSDLLGLDDGGEPLIFEPEGPVSFPSTGRPLRVEIERRTLPATATRVVYAERSTVAHLRATITLAGKTPLLAGPLRLARNESIVGKTRLDFVAVGDPVDIGFGPDDAVRAKREVKEERDTATITGTQRVRRTVRVFVSNVSGDPRSFDVIERIPVSEVGDVEVLAETRDWSFDGRDGFARRRVDLQPGAVASLLLSYEIRASSKVILPF